VSKARPASSNARRNSTRRASSVGSGVVTATGGTSTASLRDSIGRGRSEGKRLLSGIGAQPLTSATSSRENPVRFMRHRVGPRKRSRNGLAIPENRFYVATSNARP
jgi:hypothetical protein